MPELYIITGSNGAGKSSIGSTFLPPPIQLSCKVFDGDKLFMEKQRELWTSGVRAHKEAKKLAYDFVSVTFDLLVEEALSTQKDFVYEGHFTNEATWNVPAQFKARGYNITSETVHLLLCSVQNGEIADHVHSTTLPLWFQNNLTAITGLIEEKEKVK